VILVRQRLASQHVAQADVEAVVGEAEVYVSHAISVGISAALVGVYGGFNPG
jgi:hypothetical protein